MSEHKASRTLVKSPPELWAELSDQESLAGHLAERFGEIRITRLDPETTVAWEGERASGTVRIEPSGWGTRVTLTARAVQAGSPGNETRPDEPTPEPDQLPRPSPGPDPLPPAAEEPTATAAAQAPRRGLLGLLRSLLGMKPARRGEEPPAREGTSERGAEGTAPPAAVAEPPPAEATGRAEDGTASVLDPDAVLAGVLDKLGAAHHRPFSRT